MREQVKLERVYPATLEEVWELWTTREGIESWWGPDGFAVTVQKLDLRVGGQLLYTMTANAPEQMAFMKRAGMPLATKTTATFTAVEPPRHLAYDTVADFIPGMKPYDVGTDIELFAEGDSVRLVLTIDRMHDEVWTNRAVMGWQNELTKLGNRISPK
jgi:uncharacterized protein YndB with AHSA1/START domain